MHKPFRPLACSLLALTIAGCTGSEESDPEAAPPGREQSATTTALEAGATVMQRDAPTDAMNVYLSGFHPLKDEPAHQFEAHHFCTQLTEDFMQCALFDGNTGDARLHGIEYIVSARLFDELPEQERSYWHPHNGEILSGQLVAPGIPEAAEHELMKGKINSYGKTWHTWNTVAGQEQTALPLGDPRLAWSFNRDGEARPGLVEERDRRMGIDSGERRRAREDLVELARPQFGVDALAGRFGRDTRAIPGVTEAGSADSGPAESGSADTDPAEAAESPPVNRQ